MKPQDIFSPEAAKGWLPWGALAPVLGLAILIASDIVAAPLLALVARLDAKGLPLDMPSFMAFLLLGFAVLLAMVLLWVRVVERRSLAAIGLAGPGALRRFVRGTAAGMASILAVVALIFLSGGLHLAQAGSAWSSALDLLSIAVLLLCFAVQASTEEILFRGWLLSLIAKKFNIALAVALSTALFALAHFSRGQPLLVTASTCLFGLFCCAWTLRERSLYGVMGWHTGWNWLLAVGFNLPVTGIDVNIPALLAKLEPVGADWLTGGADGPEGSVACLAFFILGSGVLWLARRGNPQSA